MSTLKKYPSLNCKIVGTSQNMDPIQISCEKRLNLPQAYISPKSINTSHSSNTDKSCPHFKNAYQFSSTFFADRLFTQLHRILTFNQRLVDPEPKQSPTLLDEEAKNNFTIQYLTCKYPLAQVFITWTKVSVMSKSTLHGIQQAIVWCSKRSLALNTKC